MTRNVSLSPGAVRTHAVPEIGQNLNRKNSGRQACPIRQRGATGGRVPVGVSSPLRADAACRWRSADRAERHFPGRSANRSEESGHSSRMKKPGNCPAVAPPVGDEQSARVPDETQIPDAGGHSGGHFRDARLNAIIEHWDRVSECTKQRSFELVCFNHVDDIEFRGRHNRRGD